MKDKFVTILFYKTFFNAKANLILNSQLLEYMNCNKRKHNILNNSVTKSGNYVNIVFRQSFRKPVTIKWSVLYCRNICLRFK